MEVSAIFCFPQVLATRTCDVAEVIDTSSTSTHDSSSSLVSKLCSFHFQSANVPMCQLQQSISFSRRLKLNSFTGGYWNPPRSCHRRSCSRGRGGAGLCPRRLWVKRRFNMDMLPFHHRTGESNNYPHSHLQPIKSWHCTCMFLDCRNPTRGKRGNSAQKVQELLQQSLCEPGGDINALFSWPLYLCQIDLVSTGICNKINIQCDNKMIQVYTIKLIEKSFRIFHFLSCKRNEEKKQE